MHPQTRRTHMPTSTLPGGTYTLTEGLTVTRMGYGAMQLAGPHVFGPPTDRDEAVAVLREAVEMGITHIDTSDYYGPFVTNEIIKEALYPYPDSLHIVTKVGALRDADGGWPSARSPEQLRQAVHDNLDHLGLEALDVVNLRVGGLGVPLKSPSPSPSAFSRNFERRDSSSTSALAPSRQPRSKKRSPSPQWYACRTSITWPIELMMNSLTRSRLKASPTCLTFPSVVSRRCSQMSCTLSRKTSAPRPCPSLSRGCCSDRRTFCSFPELPRSLTFERTSPEPRSFSRAKTSTN